MPSVGIEPILRGREPPDPPPADPAAGECVCVGKHAHAFLFHTLPLPRPLPLLLWLPRAKFSENSGVGGIMAGRALRKRILAEVAHKGGADWLFDQIASGITVAKIAKDYGCTRSYVSRALNSIPEYAEALSGARNEAADALVEEGLEMVDGLSGKSSTSEIAATREKVYWRKFMAGSLNQDRYGLKPQTSVTISIGDMHLDALRKVNVEIAALDAEDLRRDVIDGECEDVTDGG